MIKADNKESTVQFSETKAHIKAANSYDRRIRLLTASGLIAGITPLSERKRFPQQTLDIVLSKQGGGN